MMQVIRLPKKITKGRFSEAPIGRYYPEDFLLSCHLVWYLLFKENRLILFETSSWIIFLHVLLESFPRIICKKTNFLYAILHFIG